MQSESKAPRSAVATLYIGLLLDVESVVEMNHKQFRWNGLRPKTDGALGICTNLEYVTHNHYVYAFDLLPGIPCM